MNNNIIFINGIRQSYTKNTYEVAITEKKNDIVHRSYIEVSKDSYDEFRTMCYNTWWNMVPQLEEFNI